MHPLPFAKPNNPRFSTGPTAKRPGYDLSNLNRTLLGRSHRSVEILALLKTLISKIKTTLKIPADYRIVLTPGSDTGAMELALWNLMGPKPVDCVAWEAFGYMWLEDLAQLQIKNVREFRCNYGDFPNLEKVNFQEHDVIFTYCGTTSGIVFPVDIKIPADRKGLIIADATSYVFGEKVIWENIDVLTFSWQKCLGGEAQTGVLVLSPKALARLNTYSPAWPIPHLFKIKQNNKVDETLLDTGLPLNTLSILTLLDFIDSLDWVENMGGLAFCQQKTADNFKIIYDWVQNSSWVSFVSKDNKNLSKLACCLQVTDPKYLALSPEFQLKLLNDLHKILADEQIAYDIRSHRKAPLGLRIWCGVTVEEKDLMLLTQWLDHYFHLCLEQHGN
ncbi:Phosphoserine aminotransferase [Candidatus Hepatincolaceae symbiont of Richtersius coronifer]